MFKKTREQIDSDRRDQTKLYTQVQEMEKLVYQVDNVRHLEAGRRVTVGGMNANHRFIIEKERLSWQNQLALRKDRLRFEERETKEFLRTFLDHLKRMRGVKNEIA